MYLQDPHVLLPRHHPLAERPILGKFHFHIFCIRIYLLLLLSTLLNLGSWPFKVYVQIIVFYVFAYCGVWLVLLLRISFRLFCAFLLWSGCWVSHEWSGHLGSGQTTLSTTDTSCYHHCNELSSGGELNFNCLHWAVPCDYLMRQLYLHWRPTAGIDLREIAGLFEPSMLCGFRNTAFPQYPLGLIN